MESRTSGKAKWLVVAAIFAVCVAPTFISYRPYAFRWDDSDYLARAIAASRAFWSGDVHGLGAAMVSWHTPGMTLLGLPWGALTSWDAAGNCFITLAAVTSLFAALCLYMLLRIGVKPIFLVLAAVCVGASLGPYPPGAHTIDGHVDAHTLATGFMADGLLAWEALAAVLLIPYEARIPCPSIRGAAVRGILCASILSVGALTKVSFFYFIAFIVPLLLFIRVRYSGFRIAFAWLIAFVCWSVPTTIYLLRYGQSAFAQAKTASFGVVANFYYKPLWQFLALTIRESPGLVLSLVLLATASIYIVLRKRPGLFDAGLLAWLIMIGFLVVALASPNKESRFLFPVIVALPFLTAILISNKENSVPNSFAALAAGLVCLGLVAAGVPTRHRTNRQNISRAEAVLAQAARCDAKSIVLATDSSTLNVFLLGLASEFSQSRASIGTLAFQAMSGEPIENDFRAMSKSDMVVFQDARYLSHGFTNWRVSEYEQYIRQSSSVPHFRVGNDISIYSTGCRP